MPPRGFPLRADPSLPLDGELRRVADELARAAVQHLEDSFEGDGVAAIHEARKRLKELRALLRLTRHSKAARYDLRDAAALLRSSRDADARLECIAALEERFPDSRELFERLRHSLPRRAPWNPVDAVGLVRRAMNRIAHVEVLALSRSLHRSDERARRSMNVALETRTAAAFHEWRKRVKDHGYHARILGGRCAGLALRLPALQHLAQLLGDHHDLVMLRGVAARTLDSFTGARILAMIEQRMNELESEAAAAGRDVFAQRLEQCDTMR